MKESRPIPGMVISPKEGVVPVGGTAELRVSKGVKVSSSFYEGSSFFTRFS